MVKHARHLVKIGLLAWLAVIGFDFFLHAGVLAGIYSEPSPFLLPPEEAFRLIPLGYLSFLMLIVLFVWLMPRLSIAGWKSGLVFGLIVGALISGAGYLGLLSISKVPVNLQGKWDTFRTKVNGHFRGHCPAPWRPCFNHS